MNRLTRRAGRPPSESLSIDLTDPTVSDDDPTRCSTCGRPLAAGTDDCSACADLAQTVVPTEGPGAELIAGRYLPQRLLGRGGAKEVWLAHDLTLDRPVAVSRARSGAEGAQAPEGMRREARGMAGLGGHTHAGTGHDADAGAGGPEAV